MHFYEFEFEKIQNLINSKIIFLLKISFDTNIIVINTKQVFYISIIYYYQLVSRGGKAVLLGDDTWAQLYPKRWIRSAALPSFNTWDLDTVDNGIYYCLIYSYLICL